MKSRFSVRLGLLAGLLGAMLTLVGCMQTVHINRLLSDPGHWANKDVRVSGNVQNSLGLMGTGAYSINDGTGTLWVLSRGGVPGRGSRVDAQGKVIQGMNFLGRNFGVAMREDRHHVH